MQLSIKKMTSFLFVLFCFFLSSCAQRQDSARIHVVDTSGHNKHAYRSSERIWASKYVVKKNDTLSSIARRSKTDIKTLAQRNAIIAPYVLHPGDVLQIKDYSTKNKTKKNKAKTSKSKSTKKKSTTKVAKNKAKKAKWLRPVESKAKISRYMPKKKPNSLVYVAKPGDNIRATAAGKVVYAESTGISGYKNLIIIKHKYDYLSVYANNSKLKVKQGAKVKAGQHIANMGDKLTFELRHRGKKINPTELIP